MGETLLVIENIEDLPEDFLKNFANNKGDEEEDE